MLQKELDWVEARRSIVSQFEIKQSAPADHDSSEIDLHQQTENPGDVNKVEVDDLGLINAYKYLPLPTIEQFKK